MDSLNEIKSKHFIQDLIEEGEHVQQDFKFQISDARKIARSISAFANNKGGHLLIGVKDNGKIVGIESEEEIYMIEQAASIYCKPEHYVKCQIYRVEGKGVLKVDIAPAIKLPVKAQDENKKWKAYYRVADENVLVSPLHVKVWNNHSKEKSALINLGEKEQTLIRIISNEGRITLKDYMVKAHISKKEAENIVINLCSMKMLDFEYKGGECYIVLAED